MKKLVGLGALAFFVVLAAIVGYRMSAEAMAVVIGVVCGVVASVPLSGLILLVAQRQRKEAQQQAMPPMQRWEPYRESPPVIFVQGANPMQSRAALPPGMSLYDQPAMPTPARDFRVVGGQWVSDERGGRY